MTLFSIPFKDSVFLAVWIALEYSPPFASYSLAASAYGLCVLFKIRFNDSLAPLISFTNSFDLLSTVSVFDATPALDFPVSFEYI
ncbi:hypothetical protein [Candidatus Hamiltonella defensa]|uniref:hypothetical protein n=1 Tax=Candidatus Williamhamiltonella defendens TaxID=138072 RepID=UPI0015831044|nr:hypothetical protein [Candidatus Hamiltonella defensa]